MKKIFTLLFITGLAAWCVESQGQMISSQMAPKSSFAPKMLPVKSKFTVEGARKTIKTLHGAAAPGDSRWYSYFDAKDLAANGAGTLSGNYLFPDSNIMAEFSGSTFATPWVHNLGNTLDPTSTFFNDNVYYPGELALSQASEYSVDSIEILFAYFNETSAVDTVVVEINYTNNDFLSWFGPTSPVSTSLSADSVTFRLLLYDHLTNQLDIPAVTGMPPNIVLEIPIDSAFANDTTSNGFNVLQLAVTGLPDLGGAGVGDSTNIAVNIWVKPGFAYSLADTLNTKSYFNFFCLEENGDDTYPYYVVGDLNTTHIVPTDVKYDLPSASGWSDNFIPSYAYMGSTPGYSFENLLISYKVTCVSNCGSTGTAEEMRHLGFSLSQNMPNPANNRTDIQFTLSEPTEATIKITDMLGRDLHMMNLGALVAGTHKVELATSEMESGIYFYTLTAAGHSQTRKMIVAH